MGSEPEGLVWRWRAFEALSVGELQHIHRVRQEVFVREQGSLYVDADAWDLRAHHLAAWHPPDELPWAYARLLEPGVKHAEAVMGRVLVLPPARGRGLGRALVRRVLEQARQMYAQQGIRISAQAHLLDFYGSFGFAPVGAAYLEDGIAHIEMLWGPVAPFFPGRESPSR